MYCVFVPAIFRWGVVYSPYSFTQWCSGGGPQDSWGQRLRTRTPSVQDTAPPTLRQSPGRAGARGPWLVDAFRGSSLRFLSNLSRLTKRPVVVHRLHGIQRYRHVQITLNILQIEINNNRVSIKEKTVFRPHNNRNIFEKYSETNGYLDVIFGRLNSTLNSTSSFSDPSSWSPLSAGRAYPWWP